VVEPEPVPRAAIPPAPDVFDQEEQTVEEPPVSEPIASPPFVSEPVASELAVSEPLVVEQPEQAATLVRPTEPQEVRPHTAEPAPGSRRAAGPAHREASLVPPYKKLDVEEMIDMTAMVDIVFFLLIFFLVTSMHAIDSTIPMPTPDPQKGAAREPTTVAAIEADDNYVVVRIDRNDKISVEGSEVRTDRDLLFKLRDLRLSSAHPEKLLVVGHGDATHGTVVMVLDAGRELGMDQVKLTVKDEEE
jgi:biopolymer transport protein ExbD